MTKDSAEEKVIRINCDRAGAIFSKIRGFLPGTNYVKEFLLNFDEFERQSKLNDLAKRFEIVPPKQKEVDWTLRFEWHDAEEGETIFNLAIEKVLLNMRNTVLSDIDELANVVSTRNSLMTEKLNADLYALEDTISLRTDKRLLFLREQSAIAKELGIEKNALDESGLLQSQNSGVSLSVNSSEVPFYLRGYKAIDKEIKLLSSRSKEEALSIDGTYVSIKEKLSAIQSDVSVQQILFVKNVVASDVPNDWVRYDLALSDGNSQNKPILYLALAIMLGGMIGVFYILLRSVIRKRAIVGVVSEKQKIKLVKPVAEVATA